MNASTNCGWVPLHIACLNHDYESEKLLKSVKGIIIDAKDNEGICLAFLELQMIWQIFLSLGVK